MVSDRYSLGHGLVMVVERRRTMQGLFGHFEDRRLVLLKDKWWVLRPVLVLYMS